MACPGLIFNEWVNDQKLARTSDFAELRGAQIAIDADDYVNRILAGSASREPLLPALGGLPMGIKKHVNHHLALFAEYNITPRFVFSGLDIAVMDRTASSREARRTADSLNDAWNLYSHNRADAAVEEFGKSCTYRTFGVRRWLTQYLIKQGVSCMLAPYSAAAQITYWKYHLKKNADAVAGSIDLLMFGADKLITAFDWDAKTFAWTTGDLVRTKLSLSQDQFVDLSLLSGMTMLPPLDEIQEAQSPIDIARNILGRANLDGVLASTMSKNEHYPTLYKKAKVAVKHVPVMKADGKIEALNYAEVYDNLHDCVGRRLPDEIVYYCTRGFVNPKILNTRTQMELYEASPLDGGNSQIYRDLIQQKLVPIRQQTQAVLSRRLHRYYNRMDISLVCWFQEASSNTLGVPEALSALSKSADQWLVDDSTLASFQQYDKQALEALPLTTTIELLSDDSNAERTISSTSKRGQLKSGPEFLSNATWRFLQARGYIDNAHKLTPWGQAYNKAMAHAKSSGYISAAAAGAEVEEAIFLAIELARLDLLNGTPMFTSPLYTGAPLRGTETDKANTNLISRVACLATFRHRELGFTGPLSRHLLAYQQVVSAVRTSLRDMLEISAVDMLLTSAFSRDISPKQWSVYGAELPLLKEPDLGLALVVKSYLDELSNDPARRSDITRWFPQALDIHADLDMAWKLWDTVNVAIQSAEAISPSTKTNFSSADEWLKQKLTEAQKSLANGA